ncbi:MAG TPA: Asp-tRNA(Asn)/Glu-tRNA(Gln) amidotransferase subunit GatC [Candidatus Babeliales bacterium]|nr:Asp-tRNA(Asn)/Glu-tRNA(Gln) amidotransferase subunit GatC [Candidatus Babeliales bacterium]
MIKLSREEVYKIAEISKLELQDQEVDHLIKQLEDVLSYAKRVTEIAASASSTASELLAKPVNITRPDEIIPTNSADILAQAPQELENYFVVPTVIESN